jgi:DNA-binding GntR family transcriptional regulator
MLHTANGSNESRREYAYNAIRKRLVTLDIPPGMAFSEGQLAAEFAFSKTPVREALSKLQHEGLIEVEPRVGYRATPITVGDAKDLLSLRILLEGEAAALASGRIHYRDVIPAVARVEELSKLTYDPEDRPSIWRFLETNTEFHMGIARIGNNRYLTDALQAVLTLCERLLHAGMALTPRPGDLRYEHVEIIKAILTGDPEVARAVAVKQAELGRSLILGALLSSSSVLRTWIEIPKAGKP